MEPLKKIVKNQYFPAAAVLLAVILFWVIAAFGGLSLLNNNQPPMATLTWMLFVYAAAVLTPLAGVLAGMDLVRRWLRNREAAAAYEDEAGVTPGQEPAAEVQPAADRQEPDRQEPVRQEPVRQEPVRQEPVRQEPVRQEPVRQTANRQATSQPNSQPLKKPAQSKQRKKAA